MTLIIGLTGGIGSGKTTVARLLEKEGIPVYIADDEARKIVETPEATQQILEAFGADVFVNGRIDRKKLAQIVFQDPQQLKRLNEIVHPLVKIHFNQWLGKYKEVPFVVKESAILFESGSYLGCDKIIAVTAPEETRINRVILRDQASREEVLNRIRNQWTDAQRAEKSDFVLENVNSEDMQKQLKNILKILSNLH